MHIISLIIAMCLIHVAILVNNVDLKVIEKHGDQKQDQVVVRAVFINCESNVEQNNLENEATRFQREELFKHSALQGCQKKIALTVKMISDPDESSGDEYIPIEHVFDGSSKKRARLLDPYILRIRRDSAVQAYKLHRVDTVSGIITKSGEGSTNKFKKSRVQRNLDNLSERKEWQQLLDNTNRPKTTESEVGEIQNSIKCLINKSDWNVDKQLTSMTTKISTMLNVTSLEIPLNEVYPKNLIGQDTRELRRVKRDGCTLDNNPSWKRDKRHQHNIIVEDITDDYQIPWVRKDRFYRKLEHIPNTAESPDDKSTTSKIEGQNTESHLKRTLHDKQKENHHKASSEKEKTEDGLDESDNLITPTTKPKTNSNHHYVTRKIFDSKRVKQTNSKKPTYDEPENNFVLYDIGIPEIWYTVHVQLFEKMSTLEGKTLWNDITKGEVASVSALHPEWTDSDLNVRYKPTEWITKDEFMLPVSSNLCLLIPVPDEGPAGSNDDVSTGLGNVGKYIVLPKEDIVDIGAKSLLSKRDGNYSDFESMPHNSNINEPKRRRRVLVRVSRALLTEKEDDIKVSKLGSDQFLTVPHRRPIHAQIDLEARADDNQIIRVGASGSINTVVADNSRRTRSVITIQATNKGLAAARFRVKTRDCGPEMASLLSGKENELIAGPILVPPRHTQRFKLDLSTKIPVNTVHCSVALVNDDDETVAVRDVAIKKGDRCFCVWHCDCVCLNDDPKLLCREMTEPLQVAAGLSPRERSRRARSACYPDVVTLNLFVVVVGVLIALLLLGLTKACFGLICRCVSRWGLDILIQMPRKLDHYYEPGLRDCPVVYDDEGWPVHPDTKKRNVRVISRAMEFILNIIFFITVPVLMLYDAVKQMLRRSPGLNGYSPDCKDHKKYVSSPHDMQMRPLLHERHRTTADVASSCVDSEQDDTEYVLTQMQKSKESLAKSQKKFTESGTSSATARKLSHNILHPN